METIEYHGWEACRLANEQVELIAVISIGPRILHFGMIGQENELYVHSPHLGKTGGEDYRFYGGHRLWHAPESDPRTYAPDNQPVEARTQGDYLRLRQAVEPSTGIQKELDIRLAGRSAQVEIIHRLRNTNLWPVQLAPWAITQMAAGGTALLPLPPLQPHSTATLLPTRALNLWSYSDLSDGRLSFHSRALLMRHDPRASTELKVGTQNLMGWVGYANHGRLFIKHASYHPDEVYPDRDSSVEIYTDARFLEMETLGPLSELQPGQSVEHRENWFLLDGVELPESAAQASEKIVPRVESLLHQLDM